MTRSLLQTIAGLIVVLAIGLTGWTWWSSRAAPGFFILTPTEVAKYRAIPDQPEIATRGVRVIKASGPGITFSSPNQDVLTSPVDIDVSLSARDGVSIDMNSIRIEYKMGPAWLNVTGRIMKQASVRGNRLFARGADLPAGRHTMRLSVNDKEARVTQAVVSFTIR